MEIEAGQSATSGLLFMARKVAGSLRDGAVTPSKRVDLCIELLSGNIKTKALIEFSEKISRFETNERHYWIGTFYALLLPKTQRRSQAAYFTPPHLSQGVLQLVCDQGFDLLKHSAIDPAAGGAAFLSTLAGKMHAAGARVEGIVDRLHGIEIDPGLASLSEMLIGDRIAYQIDPASLVRVQDSLLAPFSEAYDLVVANPPYGRVFPAELADDNWRDVCHPGHINKYALFTGLCFRLAKPGGLVALVLPSSFMAGPLYGRLRAYVRQRGEVLVLGSVTNRDDVFVDVAQDISILVARAGTSHSATKAVTFGDFVGFRPFKPNSASKLPPQPEQPWAISGHNSRHAIGGATLSDYGATVRAGYFVWNRELERMAKRQRTKLDVPLVWARNVRAGSFCTPEAKKGTGVDFVRFEVDSPAIVKANAIVMQRTTNSKQSRRLVAARISPSVIKKWGGFVSENHTILITAPQVQTLNTLCFLLNSKAVDARYRQLSGTASVSVMLLRTLDLPDPGALSDAIARFGKCDKAIEEAYANAPVCHSQVSA